MQKKFIGFLWLLLSLSFAFPAFAKTIKLKNGDTIEGKILEKTDKYIKVESAGASLTYYLDEIESINNDQLSRVVDATTPGEIIGKVKATYKSLETFKTYGTVVMDMDAGGKKVVMHTNFNMVLKKPNLYLIYWTQTEMMQFGGVWNDGTQPFIYMGLGNAYVKMASDELALASATGISFGGATITMPSIFLSVFKNRSTLELINPTLEGVEKVGSEDCYVISGATSISKKETFWVSKSKYLIMKHVRSLEVPQEGRKRLEMTDEQLETVIKSMGLENTAEIKQKMRDEMKEGQKALADAKTQGSITETYVDISSPELSKSDFQYQLPTGAVLKESLFGNK